MSELFKKHYLRKQGKNYVVDVYGFDHATRQIIYCVDNGKERRAKEHYCCGFGGNPYPGTLINYYIINLDGKNRARLEMRA